MLERFFNEKPSIFDPLIIHVIEQMHEYGPEEPEYSKMVEYLDRLTQMKAQQRRNRVSPDTIVLAAANILGILVIVAYEQKHVMTSKGLGFVMKPKNS